MLPTFLALDHFTVLQVGDFKIRGGPLLSRRPEAGIDLGWQNAESALTARPIGVFIQSCDRLYFVQA